MTATEPEGDEHEPATVGTATAEPGARATGYLEVTDLPTGGAERLPVIVARGEAEGPTLWVTGGVHGNEVTGVAAVQDVLAAGVPDGLRGTVVCLPMCNPAGIRRGVRTSYYHDDDPNRYFPAGDLETTTHRRVQELIDERLYETITGSADALLDLHTAQVGSVPFVIRDRVLYDGGEEDDESENGNENENGRDETDARALADRLDELARATELPLVTEFAADEYIDRSLHRSTAGAVLNEAGIPALTLELGGHDAIEDAARAAGVAAVYRTMVHLGLLERVPDRIEDAAPTLEAPVSYPVRRHVGPHASSAGLCRPRVEPGEAFEAGERLATVVDPFGTERETLESDRDGYVLGWGSAAVYENDPVSSLAVRDEGELIAPRE